MEVIRNKIIPFRGYKAVNVFGILFVRGSSMITEWVIRHEEIHTAQMKELLYVPFYLLYILEFLWHYARKRNFKDAYMAISFEVEAYKYEFDKDYLSTRKHYAQWRQKRKK
jgi:hypothetical protein